MKDSHKVVSFSCNGERTLGVVISHYTNPLDDYYILYADYTLYKCHSTEEDASIVISNVIIPACDVALADFVLKRQHLRDVNKGHEEFRALKDAIDSGMNTDNLFIDDTQY